MIVKVSFPEGRPHWAEKFDPVLASLRERGVDVQTKTHRIESIPEQPFVPGDDMPFVSIWKPGHAPGKATRDGLGITGLKHLEELAAELA